MITVVLLPGIEEKVKLYSAPKRKFNSFVDIFDSIVFFLWGSSATHKAVFAHPYSIVPNKDKKRKLILLRFNMDFSCFYIRFKNSVKDSIFNQRLESNFVNQILGGPIQFITD